MANDGKVGGLSPGGVAERELARKFRGVSRLQERLGEGFYLVRPCPTKGRGQIATHGDE